MEQGSSRPVLHGARSVARLPSAAKETESIVPTFENLAIVLSKSENDARQASELETHDDGQVDADGPSELKRAVSIPVAPYSVFTKRHKWSLVAMVSASAFFSPISATIFLPALTDIASDLNVDIARINLSVTVYMIFQGFSPSFWGSMADVLGRRPLYLLTLVIYIGSNIGLALTNTYWLLMVLRCVQPIGSASMIAFSQGVVADIASPSERGGMISIANSGAMLAPALGPFIGALLAQNLGWHSMFWFLAIAASVLWVLLFFFLPETLRSIVGDGSIEPKSSNKPFYHILTHRKYPAPTPNQTRPKKQSWADIDWLAPFAMIVSQKDIALILVYGAVLFSLTFACIVTLASDLKDAYGLTTLQNGLCYMAYGFGCMFCSFVCKAVLDRDFAKVAEKASSASSATGAKAIPKDRRKIRDLTYFPIEKARLRSAPWLAALLVGASIVYGWSLQYRVHLAVPLIMSALIGIGGFMSITAVSTLVVDCYPSKASSITASNNIVRGVIGAATTSFISPLVAAMGAGPAFTLLAGFAGVFSVVALYVELRYGMRWRQMRAFAEQEAQEASNARQS